jgi:hypothetical protein
MIDIVMICYNGHYCSIDTNLTQLQTIMYTRSKEKLRWFLEDPRRTGTSFLSTLLFPVHGNAVSWKPISPLSMPCQPTVIISGKT